MNPQDPQAIPITQHDPDSGLTVVRRHDGTWTMGGLHADEAEVIRDSPPKGCRDECPEDRDR